MATAIAAVIEAVGNVLSPPPVEPRTPAEEVAHLRAEFEKVEAEDKALDAERSRVIVDHGSQQDTAYGDRKGEIAKRLASIQARRKVAERMVVAPPVIEDARVTKARENSAEKDSVESFKREALAALYAKRERQVREGAPVADGVKTNAAIDAAKYDVDVAASQARDARLNVAEIVSLVAKEKQDATRAAIVEAASPLLLTGKVFLEARERYIEARDRAAHAGVHAPAPPSTFTRERLSEFAQALGGLI